MVTVISLGIALYVLHLELQHLWPSIPQWMRALLSFLVAAVVGEFWVSRYWSTLRMSAAQTWEVLSGYAFIAALVTLIVLVLELRWGLRIPVQWLAGIAYLSLLWLDISHGW